MVVETFFHDVKTQPWLSFIFKEKNASLSSLIVSVHLSMVKLTLWM